MRREISFHSPCIARTTPCKLSDAICESTSETRESLQAFNKKKSFSQNQFRIVFQSCKVLMTLKTFSMSPFNTRGQFLRDDDETTDCSVNRNHLEHSFRVDQHAPKYSFSCSIHHTDWSIKGVHPSLDRLPNRRCNDTGSSDANRNVFVFISN